MSRPRTVLGFDYGRRRIGVAVGQELTGTARALGVVPARRGEPDWERIRRLVAQWRPDLLVVGCPRHMDGSEHEMTRAARRFARRLGGRCRLPVAEVDERLTSAEAEALGGAEPVDAIAARLIVESWLRGDGAGGGG
ncbi:Holliday junction resolvase RuvX [Inmirania thermothiophila]|uniref:Putative pre-16S rRNA nuclease n=1 Tax=Inmirania thermothiophila TaxID=1750597 RepID=A0A3N1Y6S3_9GAMM|nr:Holliday junction resolvase RuvX [Inmirania thermothiophila]ROR34516.1 putative Holliday junction resolvase [Inmirania thermothiophila]